MIQKIIKDINLREYFLLPLWCFPLGNLNCNDCLACLSYPTVSLTSQHVTDEVRMNNPCCSVLLWISFCLLQVNHQKRVGMVSTYNILWTDLKTSLGETIPHCVLIQRRSADAEHWTVTLSNWKNYKSTVLKNFAIFIGKNLCEIFNNTYFKEHLVYHCFWIDFKVTVWNFVSGLH